jgi:hypothetical protein
LYPGKLSQVEGFLAVVVDTAAAAAGADRASACNFFFTSATAFPAKFNPVYIEKKIREEGGKLIFKFGI